MKSGKFWLAVLVAGIVANVLDFVVQAQVLTHAYYAKMSVMKPDTAIGLYVFADFVAVLVLAWVYARVGSIFGGGIKGGATAGFYLGVLVSFPAYHFVFLMFKEYPYALAWINTVYSVIWYVILGAILGAMMGGPAPAPAAAKAA